MARLNTALTFPSVLSRIALKRDEISGCSNPLWKRMLTQPNSATLSAHFTIHKERLAATPESHAK